MPDSRALALYVHWPFCQAKCPYCDFNSHVVSAVDHAAWRRALVSEVERYAAELPDRILTSIFFGGGTPSLMEPDTAAAVIDAARRAWRTANDVEITLEANPTSSEAARFRAFHDAGVNRVSIGLQALNNQDLKALGRLHSADEGIAAFDMARSVFNRCSFDLIYARQNQSLEDWKNELATALALQPDHVSLYQLTIEPETAFGERFDRGLLRGLPGDDLSADMFDLTKRLCDAAGLPAYEISNHARPDAESRHNLTYWRSGDWVGIGPGAHGRFTKGSDRTATEATRMPAAWLRNVAAGVGIETRSTYPTSEILEERLLMGLRLTNGINVPELTPELREKAKYINTLTENPLIEVEGDHVELTQQGRPLLNTILKELLS